jgi:hypothetical protein
VFIPEVELFDAAHSQLQSRPYRLAGVRLRRRQNCSQQCEIERDPDYEEAHFQSIEQGLDVGRPAR